MFFELSLIRAFVYQVIFIRILHHPLNLTQLIAIAVDSSQKIMRHKVRNILHFRQLRLQRIKERIFLLQQSVSPGLNRRRCNNFEEIELTVRLKKRPSPRIDDMVSPF